MNRKNQQLEALTFLFHQTPTNKANIFHWIKMCSHPNTALANCGISTSSYITHQHITTTSDSLPQTSRPASQLCFYQCRPKYKTKENHWKLIQEDLVREQILLISLNSLRCGKVLRVGSVWGRCVNCKLGTVLTWCLEKVPLGFY